MPTLPSVASALLAVPATPQALLNWDRAIAQTAGVATVSLFFAGLILPWLLPTALYWTGTPPWLESSLVGRGRRCLLPALFLAAAGLVVAFTWQAWAAGWLAVGDEYFTQAVEAKLQYEGPLGLTPGRSMAVNGTLVLLLLSSAPLAGGLLSWLLYFVYERSFSLKARSVRQLR